ncbi:hypothetical protein, unlikely [Trypanosoma congolense IL3000]|uniref:Uncharacterized protein n=1 Tax=Trypanosoma congolense (strain IL3000) TaxID=1068625 RepID=F9W5D5_TRYCI|nr:hypothetical protein, unlikely [Trypanosoma congolense IL3000]CCD12386.1 hypothetical protein, unlikely [Trypanosoma congolense IL3000]
MRLLLQFAAGALFSVSLFVFADGLIMAKRTNLPYNFLMWLPLILMFCGMFILCYVDVRTISSRYELLDDSSAVRDKAFFFTSVLFMLSGFAVSLWKAIDPYANNGDLWPGASLVIQSILLMASSALIFFRNSWDDNALV